MENRTVKCKALEIPLAQKIFDVIVSLGGAENYQLAKMFESSPFVEVPVQQPVETPVQQPTVDVQ